MRTLEFITAAFDLVGNDSLLVIVCQDTKVHAKFSCMHILVHWTELQHEQISRVQHCCLKFSLDHHPFSFDEIETLRHSIAQ